MEIEIKATKEEIAELKDCLLDEAGQTCSNLDGMAYILTELIDNSFGLPGYNIKIIKVKT